MEKLDSGLDRMDRHPSHGDPFDLATGLERRSRLFSRVVIVLCAAIWVVLLAVVFR